MGAEVSGIAGANVTFQSNAMCRSPYHITVTGTEKDIDLPLELTGVNTMVDTR
jgi:hypothetical protein